MAMRVLVEFATFTAWLYILVKLFVFDVDAYVVGES